MNNIGLILNVIGTLFLAFSFNSQKDDLFGNTTEDGKKLHFHILNTPYYLK